MVRYEYPEGREIEWVWFKGRRVTFENFVHGINEYVSVNAFTNVDFVRIVAKGAIISMDKGRALLTEPVRKIELTESDVTGAIGVTIYLTK